MALINKHAILERNVTLLAIFAFLVVTIGGLVQIVPLFYLDNTIEEVEGMRPYTPLELAGRDVYLREGCYVCHSQMIRPMRDEVERYGHYSLAAESMYDHPFQWGSKRTGPDLARVGGKYSDDWHVAHLTDPRSVVPASIMPGYPFLAENRLETRGIGDHLKVNTIVGVPYTEEQIAGAAQDILGQATPDTDAADGFMERYPDALVRDFDGNPKEVTEMDARIFSNDPMGLKTDLLHLDLEDRIAFDPGTHRLFINFEKLRIRTQTDVDRIRDRVHQICAPLDRPVDVIVNYDGARIEDDIAEEYAAMAADLEDRFYGRVSRYSSSAFMRMKLGETLRRQSAPHIFETGEEAREFLRGAAGK